MKYMIRATYICARILIYSLSSSSFFSQTKWHTRWDPILPHLCCAPMVVKYFYDGSVIQLCIYRMLDACILLKL
jgi:hypothetical protein